MAIFLSLPHIFWIPARSQKWTLNAWRKIETANVAKLFFYFWPLQNFPGDSIVKNELFLQLRVTWSPDCLGNTDPTIYYGPFCFEGIECSANGRSVGWSLSRKRISASTARVN